MDGPPSPEAGGRREHADFPSALLANRRTLSVWLPPGYGDDPDRRYPVLYLHDGQNLFEPAASGAAWQADATAGRLIAAGRLPPLMLVGIHSTPERLDEYAAYRDGGEKAGGRAGLYARFVLDEVKPFIDREYRTLPGRRHTGVCGSSLGGLVSLTMAHEHHARFALCGAVSPSLWWARDRVFADLEADAGWMRRMRFWVDMGTREDAGRGHAGPAIRRLRRLVGCFDAAGLVPGRHSYSWEVAGGEHHEADWAARFDKMLLFLFGR
jgi:predicted alpha/beta superfamily hydrolase